MKNIVVLTGAGISAESGLQTFRDSGGLWNGHNIEEVASIEGFIKNPQKVLDFYNQRRNNVLDAQPNAAHYFLSELQNKYNVQVITQNIDDLHERAGQKNVLHLHGQINKMRSIKNEEILFDYNKDIQVGDLSPIDGTQLRPHIVWFGEAVPAMEVAATLVQQADVFMVIGTSLQVYPAASLIDFVSPNATKIIADKKIPPISSGYYPIHFIEKPATEAIEKIQNILETI